MIEAKVKKGSKYDFTFDQKKKISCGRLSHESARRDDILLEVTVPLAGCVVSRRLEQDGHRRSFAGSILGAYVKIIFI